MDSQMLWLLPILLVTHWTWWWDTIAVETIHLCHRAWWNQNDTHWELHPYWIALTVMEMLCIVPQDKRNHHSYWAVNHVIKKDTKRISLIRHTHKYYSGMNVVRLTNLFLVYQACFTYWNPYLVPFWSQRTCGYTS